MPCCPELFMLGSTEGSTDVVVAAIQVVMAAPEAPAQAPVLPVHVPEAPAHVLDTPAHVAEAPAHVPDTPAQVPEAPAHELEATEHVPDTPAQVPEAPAHELEATEHVPEAPAFDLEAMSTASDDTGTAHDDEMSELVAAVTDLVAKVAGDVLQGPQDVADASQPVATEPKLVKVPDLADMVATITVDTEDLDAWRKKYTDDAFSNVAPVLHAIPTNDKQLQRLVKKLRAIEYSLHQAFIALDIHYEMVDPLAKITLHDGKVLDKYIMRCMYEDSAERATIASFANPKKLLLEQSFVNASALLNHVEGMSNNGLSSAIIVHIQDTQYFLAATILFVYRLDAMLDNILLTEASMRRLDSGTLAALKAKTRTQWLLFVAFLQENLGNEYAAVDAYDEIVPLLQ